LASGDHYHPSRAVACGAKGNRPEAAHKL
jgi:hypothetical protein